MPGLYIHIPFCQHKCGYCDFYSVETASTGTFLPALIAEMEQTAASWNQPFDTLYIGGGTPSLLKQAQITRLINEVKSRFRITGNAEWTIEVNPGSVTATKLSRYLNLGINRLSIGAQSFRRSELQLLERTHTAEQIVKTVQVARSAGFQNIGLDLIYGLPYQTQGHWEQTLQQATALEPVHISAYALTWKRNTKLGQSFLNGTLPVPEEDHTADLFLKAHAYLESNGFHHYEISNYAKPGFECLHNQQYWSRRTYLGLGPSAHSFDGQRRGWNISDVEQYMDHLRQNKSPVEAWEKLSESDLALEKTALGLRTDKGILIGKQISEEQAKQLCREGLAERKKDRLILTPRGFLLADEIAVQVA
jgi:oxygen-independent coproporphyrinogen-3 oxidase